ncbi:MAG TPA: hypothetical protein GXX20_03475 [Clostridiaceae bacterium]|nr:hypothetical protein [Clostridiaceae bacterium]
MREAEGKQRDGSSASKREMVLLPFSFRRKKQKRKQENRPHASEERSRRGSKRTVPMLPKI